MVEVKVNPGICGLHSTIKVSLEDMQYASIEVESDCGYIKEMAEQIKKVDGYNECFSPFGSSEVFKAANACCKHAACPVPTGIIKGIEVACGLALPKDVEINIMKNEDQ